MSVRKPSKSDEAINRDEWMLALKDAEGPQEEDALTVREIGEMFGLKKEATQRRVAALVTANRARVTRKKFTDAMGRSQYAVAYVLTK